MGGVASSELEREEGKGNLTTMQRSAGSALAGRPETGRSLRSAHQSLGCPQSTFFTHHLQLRKSVELRAAPDSVPREEVDKLQVQVQQMEQMLTQLKQQLKALAPRQDDAPGARDIPNPK